MGKVVEDCRLVGYGCPCFPSYQVSYGGACYFMDFRVFDFSQFFCRRAFSPAPVSPFVIPAPASLDTKAPMIPCMAILLVPLSLHFFASFSYFSASMLLFSFLAFSAFLYSSFSLCPAMSPMRWYPTWESIFTYSCFSSIFFLSKISESVLSAFAVSWLVFFVCYCNGSFGYG